MAEKTKIEWCDSTFNPWIGCTKVSAGCDNCYAERDFDLRKHRVKWGPGNPRSRTSPANWKKPEQWNAETFVQCNGCGWRGPLTAAGDTGACLSCGKVDDFAAVRRRVFCASLGDVFDNEVPAAWLDELFGLIAATPNLDWLVLTKRIGNARAYLTDPATPRRVETMKHVVLAGRLEERHAAERTAEIPGWPGYFITSKGRVLSDRTNAGTCGTERHELKPQAGEAGHARVMLQVEGQTGRQLVHRLVLAAFDRQPRGDEQGCHIDGDASNNALWNLRWGDQASNWSDSKRHGTRRRYSKLSPAEVEAMRTRAAAGETAAALAPEFDISDTQVRNILRGDQWKPEATMEWPLSWMWLGATICNQAEADRDVPKLLSTPAHVRFLSIEPMLGPIDLTLDSLVCTPCPWCVDQSADPDTGIVEHCRSCEWTGKSDEWGIDWIISGGESGPHARPMHPDWVRSLRDQCAAAGVPFLFKQWGEWLPWTQFSDSAVDDEPEQTRFATMEYEEGVWRDVGKPDYWATMDGDIDDEQCVGRVGKKSAGRKLDGVTHDGYPAASTIGGVDSSRGGQS